MIETKPALIPPEVEAAISEFRAGNWTGTIELNLKDGQILGAYSKPVIGRKVDKQNRIT